VHLHESTPSHANPTTAAESPRRRIARDENGLALVWMTLFLMVVLGFAALAIDIGRGYYIAQREQNAADAASLAGTIYLPSDVTSAYGAAQSVASSNGFTNGVNGVTVTPLQLTKLSQLKVTITQTVPTWFAKVLGFRTVTVRRTSTADYRPPVAMGSPNPQYGNDPDSSGAPASATYPNLWGNVTSYGTEKQNGNAYTSGQCDSTPIDDCSGTNSNYDSKGYYYAIHFNSAATVNVQVFDPGFVAVGNNCLSGNDYNAGLNTASTVLTTKPAGWPVSTTYSTAPSFSTTRYTAVTSATASPTTSNPGNRYCTGDQPFGDGSPSSLPTTSYSMVGPASVQGDPATATATSGCSTWTFPGVEGTSTNSVIQMIKNGTKAAVTPTNQYIATYFRQWFPICTISGAANTDYFLQVNGDTTGNGNNNFAIRAAGSGGGLSSAVSIYGNAKMAIFANAGANTLSQFYLARILSSDAGHQLSVSLFDIGDAGSGVTGSLTIVPPTDSGLSSFSGCTASSESSSFTPMISSGCSLTGVSSSTYQGRWVTVNVPIPATYTCTDSSATGCWFRINYLFNGQVNDVTSWTAVLAGDPVRIVG
jgi:Flp pilus assembly protein TadG